MTRIAAVALCTAVLGCGSWETERSLVIEAPPDAVWSLLADLDAYPEWNSYSTRAEGSLTVDGIVTIEAQLGGETRQVANRVTRVEPERALCWHSTNWYELLVRGTRCRFLEPEGSGATHFRHHEIMEGPLARGVERIYRPRIEAGLERMNDDLKRAAEAPGR